MHYARVVFPWYDSFVVSIIALRREGNSLLEEIALHQSCFSKNIITAS